MYDSYGADLPGTAVCLKERRVEDDGGIRPEKIGKGVRAQALCWRGYIQRVEDDYIRDGPIFNRQRDSDV